MISYPNIQSGKAVMAEYGSLRFVDKVGNNFLFRGGAPIVNGAFDTDLPAKLKNAYMPLQLPPQFYLVVICLLHPNVDDSPSSPRCANGSNHRKLPISRSR
jgi:hypothetical protein